MEDDEDEAIKRRNSRRVTTSLDSGLRVTKISRKVLQEVLEGGLEGS